MITDLLVRKYLWPKVSPGQLTTRTPFTTTAYYVFLELPGSLSQGSYALSLGLYILDIPSPQLTLQMRAPF